MNYNCMNILKWTESQLKYTYDVSLQEATPQELHEALGQAVMMSIADNWSNSKRTRMHQRKAYYISAEYLVGRLVYSRTAKSTPWAANSCFISSRMPRLYRLE